MVMAVIGSLTPITRTRERERDEERERELNRSTTWKRPVIKTVLQIFETSSFEPRPCEKTCHPGFRLVPAQIGLYGHIRWLEA